MSHDSMCLDEHNEDHSSDLSPVLETVGDWAVTHYGLEWVGDRAGYAIAADRLWQGDWVSHLAEKSWTSAYAVEVALERARAWHAPRHMGDPAMRCFMWGGLDLDENLAVQVSPLLFETTRDLSDTDFRTTVAQAFQTMSTRPA